MMRLTRRACVLLPAACAAPPVTSMDALPGWNDDQLAAVMHAPSEAAARDTLRQRYFLQPLPRLLYTGYYEITVSGARRPGGRYVTPLLRRPPHPETFDRGEIANGALDGHGLEIAWLSGPADLFFLQLQGSGRVVLDDGGVLRVTSAGNNGRAPVSTERLFASADLSGNDLSIPALRAWCAVHPAAGRTRLLRDPSYVFFRESAAGPHSVQGMPLTPLRSLAVDPALIPLGSLVWVDVAPWRRLMMAEDTGPAIRGARADVYFGSGAQAENAGGHLYAEGRAWVLHRNSF